MPAPVSGLACGRARAPRGASVSGHRRSTSVLAASCASPTVPKSRRTGPARTAEGTAERTAARPRARELSAATAPAPRSLAALTHRRDQALIVDAAWAAAGQVRFHAGEPVPRIALI